MCEEYGNALDWSQPTVFLAAVYVLYCVVCFVHCPVFNTHTLCGLGQPQA